MDNTMDEYTLQSYFKSLCNSYTIAYNQVKRLEEQRDKLETTFCPCQELEIVENLLQFFKLSKDYLMQDK